MTTTEPRAGAAVPLRRNRDFRRLWIGQALSDFGSSMTFLALPLVLLATGYSTSAAATVGTAIMVVGVAVKVPAGYLSDRFDQRRLMLSCDLTRFVVIAGLAAWVMLGRLPLGIALAAVIVCHVALGIFRPSQSHVLRRIVPADQFGSAVAIDQARSYAGDIAAPAAAGLLVALQPGIPFAVDAATFLASAVCVVALSRARTAPRAARAQAPDSRPSVRFLAEVTAGWRFIVANRFLRRTCAFGALMNLLFAAFTYVLILGIGQQHGGMRVVGFAVSSASVAGLVGSLLAGVAQRKLRPQLALSGGAAAGACLLAVCWLGGGTVTLAAAYAVLCLFTPVSGVVIKSVLATVAPEAIYGRVVTAAGFLFQVLQPLGPLIAGLLLVDVSLPATAGLFALGFGVATIIGLLLPSPAVPEQSSDTKRDEESS